MSVSLVNECFVDLKKASAVYFVKKQSLEVHYISWIQDT